MTKATAKPQTRAEIAVAIGVSERTLGTWYSAGCPRDDIEAIKAWRQARDDARKSRDDALMDESVTSPALERYRAARAGLAELELLQRREQLIDREIMHQVLSRLAHFIREAGDKLAREYGSGAHEIVNEALDQYENVVDQFFDSLEEANAA